jgi:hypothetical protein
MVSFYHHPADHNVKVRLRNLLRKASFLSCVPYKRNDRQFLGFSMKQLAKALQDAVLRTMTARSVPTDQRADYLKWLRYYLDFCLKYRHAPRDHESLGPFLRKLAEKRQSPERQQRAAASIALYYDLMKTWATAPEANPAVESIRAPWDACYARLKEEVRLRQYSPKTFSTYATWIYTHTVKSRTLKETTSPWISPRISLAFSTNPLLSLALAPRPHRSPNTNYRPPSSFTPPTPALRSKV